MGEAKRRKAQDPNYGNKKPKPRAFYPSINDPLEYKERLNCAAGVLGDFSLYLGDIAPEIHDQAGYGGFLYEVNEPIIFLPGFHLRCPMNEYPHPSRFLVLVKESIGLKKHPHLSIKGFVHRAFVFDNKTRMYGLKTLDGRDPNFAPVRVWTEWEKGWTVYE